MTAMPDPSRTIERSAAILRRRGKSRRAAYEAVGDIAECVLWRLDLKDTTESNWLVMIRMLARRRAAATPAVVSEADCLPGDASALSAVEPLPRQGGQQER